MEVTQNKTIFDNFLTSLWNVTIELNEYNVFLTPYWLATICELLSYLLFILCSLIYWTLLSIIIKNSTPEMKLYKWYILWHSLMVFGYECGISFLRIEVLFPYPMITVNGFVKYLSLGSLNYYIADGFLFVIACCFYTTTMLFVFRFLHMTKIRFYQYFITWRFSILGHCFMLAAVTGTVIVSLHSIYEPEEKLKETIKLYNIALYEQVKDRLLFGLLKTNLFTMYSFFFWVGGAVSCILSCTFFIYLNLYKEGKSLSKKTLKLYKSLIKALIIESLVGGILVFCPLTAVAFGFMFKLPFSPIIGTISLMISNFYPISSHVITLIYIGPYRRALKEKMRSFKWFKKLFNKIQDEENGKRIFKVRISYVSRKEPNVQ